MLRGLLWLLPRILPALWTAAKFLYCVIGPWHRYDVTSACPNQQLGRYAIPAAGHGWRKCRRCGYDSHCEACGPPCYP